MPPSSLSDETTSNLPGTAQFASPGSGAVLGWLKEAVSEGDRINRSDPTYEKISETMDYVLGFQRKGARPSYLSDVTINVTKQAIRTHVAALTDIRPLFQYKTFNDAYQVHGALLNKLVTIWWINTFADLEIGNAIKYALTAGCGDVLIEYDPHYGHSGDTRLIVRDPRDTLPIRPSRDRSIQTWAGVILREAQTPNALKSQYPGYSFTGESTWGEVFTKFRRWIGMGLGSPTSTLDGLGSGGQQSKPSVIPEVNVYRCFLEDRAINLNRDPVLMGQVGSNWAYWAPPGKRLYPRKRLIVATEQQILYDGPSPYWHGLYPIARLKLEDWPWLFLGMPLTNDLRGVQDAINTTTGDILQVFKQWVGRTMVADSQAVPESEFRRFDPRKPLSKLRVKAGMGDSVKLLDGPNLPPWTFEFWNALFAKHAEISETANLQRLMQLRQMPGADTIEKYYESLTPGLRMEGRMLEAFLREVAEMVKCNVFQFKSTSERVMVLGDAGKTLSDFDYDPGNLVPALKEGDVGYSSELDASLSRSDRAQFFHKLFTFYVAPNSILAMHAQEEQLKYIQLARQGYVDFWTLLEMLEVPNVGAPPPVMLPPLGWNPEEQYDKVIFEQTGNKIPTPPPMIPRVPITITERLMAMSQLGIGQTVSAAGRKASGQAPPKQTVNANGAPGIRESR